MTLDPNKMIQVDGAPSGGQQAMKNSAFNDELRTWGDYSQIADQLLVGGVTKKVTCNGADYSAFLPAGGIPVWNASTSEYNFIAGGVYGTTIDMTAQSASNNSTMLIEIVDTTSSEVYYSEIREMPRSSGQEPFVYSFEFIALSTTSAQINATCSSNATVFDVDIFAERKN